jgi:hypothetical protein
MALWDASIGWVTLVIRAPGAGEARTRAIDHVRAMGLFEHAFEEPELTEDWPRELVSDGPTEILIEDID